MLSGGNPAAMISKVTRRTVPQFYDDRRLSILTTMVAGMELLPRLALCVRSGGKTGPCKQIRCLGAGMGEWPSRTILAHLTGILPSTYVRARVYTVVAILGARHRQKHPPP
jgi:hypothetical protein